MKKMTKNEILEVETNTMNMYATVQVGKGESSFFFDNDVDVDVTVVDESFDHEFGIEYKYLYEIKNIQTIVDEIMKRAEYVGDFTDEDKKKISDNIYSSIERGDAELDDNRWSLNIDFEI